jgi:large subunit ribosomal protein L29
MAPSELATMDPGELEHRLAESRKELFNLRFQLATGQLDNPARIGQVRKEVARILTFLRQRDLGVGEEPALERGWAAAGAGTSSAVSAPATGDDGDDGESDEEA